MKLNNLGKCLSLFLASALILGCQSEKALPNEPVKVGLDRVNEAAYRDYFAGKSLGIVTNHTAINSAGRYITEVFQGIEGVKVGALFGPEHGIRGQAEAGAKIASESNPLQGVPIYSLYGKTRKPTPEMLAGIDALVFDIQDVGARFYTYIYTMSFAMEAAAEHGIPFIVLDRPNPITGSMVQGNTLDTAFASFVGRFPISQRHGMTVGELALLFNGQGWIGEGLKAELTVIPMQNWQRNLWFDQTGLPFVKPSPNIPDQATTIVYPASCLIEGVNVSEGRGTTRPFQVFGAPWLNSTGLVAKLNALTLPGVNFKDTLFLPVRIPGASENPKYRDRTCRGVSIHISNRNKFDCYRTGISIIGTLQEMHPDSLQWRDSFFDKLVGTDRVRLAIQDRRSLRSLFDWADAEENAFRILREPYLLY